MRHLSLAVGLVAAVGAFAVTAAPALATAQFETSKAGVIQSVNKGKVAGGQAFKLGPLPTHPEEPGGERGKETFKINCPKATVTGKVTELLEPALILELHFKKCKAGGGKATSPLPLIVEYRADGSASILPSTHEPGNELFYFHMKSAACDAYIEPGEVSEGGRSEVYSLVTSELSKKRQRAEFPEGQKRLDIENNFHNLPYYLEGEGVGICDALEEPKEAENGSLAGDLGKIELARGNLTLVNPLV